jgi:NADH-quinone oxidoreductase subunit N
MSSVIILFIGGLLSPLFRTAQSLRWFSLLMLLLALVGWAFNLPIEVALFADTSMTRLFELLVLLVGIAVILHLFEDELPSMTQWLFLLSASILLLKSQTILSFVISFEAVSLLSFVLVSYMSNAKQAEAAIKLFFTGATATGILLFGVALLTLNGQAIDQAISASLSQYDVIALMIMVVGVFYKLTLFPVYAWAGDAYALMKHSHAAMLSALVKTVVAIALFQLLTPLLLQLTQEAIWVLAGIAVMTMTIGNFLALYQKNIARVLAYSSIAHAGYLFIPFVAIHSNFASTGLLYLAVAYLFMQTSVFLILDVWQRRYQVQQLADVQGMMQKDPVMTFFMVAQLLSLAGIPLLAGFISKAVAFYSGVDAGLWWLVFIALLNSALSVGYYAWFIKQMVMMPSSQQAVVVKEGKEVHYVLPYIAQAILLMGTVYFGIVAGDIFTVTRG